MLLYLNNTKNITRKNNVKETYFRTNIMGWLDVDWYWCSMFVIFTTSEVGAWGAIAYGAWTLLTKEKEA